MRSATAPLLLLLLTTAGCLRAVEPCSTAMPQCDAYEASCQERMLDALSCMQSGSGTKLESSVEVWTPERAQQEATGMATMLTEEQLTLLQRQAAAFALLRLAPESWDPATVAGAYMSTVAAFYEPGTGGIVIIDEPEPTDAGVVDGAIGAVSAASPPDTEMSAADDEARTRLMAHELTHMLRDAETGIGNFYARAGTTFDRLLAARAIVEGEAQLYAELAVLDQRGLPLDGAALTQAIEQWKQDTLVGFEQVDAPVALADRYLPYPHGFGYALSAYLAGGRRGVDALFDEPLASTRQLTLGFGATEPAGGPWSEDDTLASVASPAGPERFEPLGVFYLGMWLVDAFVQRALPAPTHDLSSGVLSSLRADALTLLYDRDTDAPAASWRMRFADEAAATAMTTLAPWPAQIAVRVEGRDAIFTAATSADARALLASAPFGPATSAVPATTTASEVLKSMGLPWLLAASSTMGMR